MGVLIKQELIKYSKLKKESKKVLDSRLSSLTKFIDCPNPTFGPDLKLDYDNINYFTSDETTMPEIENDEFIICDIHTALKKHKSLIDKYFNKLIEGDENKFTLLNSATWNNGIFIYIYPNNKINLPYENNGITKNLIIVDEFSELNLINIENSEYIIQNSMSEIYILESAECNYINFQNNSKNTYNFSLKRFMINKKGKLNFINISYGSKVSMSYPNVILNGDESECNIKSFISSSKNQILDEGIKIIHVGNNSISDIVSNNYSINGGETNYRESVSIKKESQNSKSNIKCECNILDLKSRGDIVSKNIIENNLSIINNKVSYNKEFDVKYNKTRLIKAFINNNDELDKETIKYLKRLLN